MAADLVPIRLTLTDGDLYTVWAPQWRDAGDEWEGFLGKEDDLYGFASVADLVAFVRGNTDHDLVDHPGWEKLVEASAHRLDPDEYHRFDLTTVEEHLAEKPTAESVQQLANALGIVSSIGSVCELPPVNKLFNGNPMLSSVNNGVEEFSGRAGRKRWHNIGTVVGRAWDAVLGSIEEILTTPEVDEAASARAAAELDEPAPKDELDDEFDDAEFDDAEFDINADTDTGETGEAAPAFAGGVLGGDKDFWHQVGIDPIRVMTGNGTVYTLRCYVDDRPVFLGRNGRVSVFGSERAMARYLADQHDHDMAELPTYDDIHTAATDGSLRVEVTEDNVYVLTGLADDLTDGPDAVDREQLDLVVELLRDVGEYSEDDTVDKALDPARPFGRLLGHLQDGSAAPPAGSSAEAAAAFEELERFLDSRLRRE